MCEGATETSAGETILPLFTSHYHHTGTPLQNVSPGFLTFRSRGQQNKASPVAQNKKNPDSYLIGMSLLLCRQRALYTMFSERLEFLQATYWLHFQWNYPLNISDERCQTFDTFILLCSTEIDSCCNRFFLQTTSFKGFHQCIEVAKYQLLVKEAKTFLLQYLYLHCFQIHRGILSKCMKTDMDVVKAYTASW